ncbi:site-specific DNA-methyltransferase [bacterium]|nr:site-specific DNA-methyltransferase [bacterium]
MPEIKTNILYYGDNLDILCEHIPDESIDLIYLDPPFNSKRSYNVLFRESSGAASEAQIEAFEDSWHWGDSTMRAYDDVMRGSRQDVAKLLGAMVDGFGHNDMTAYLVMMAVRLVELHRVLKSTGSIYLHCDPTAGSYLRVILDSVFGPTNFKNEIVWKRTTAHSDPIKYGSNIDIIWFYTKSSNYTWNKIFSEYSPKYLKRFRYEDKDGRIWMDDNLTAKGLTGGGYEYTFKGVRSLWRVPLVTMKKLDGENRLHYTKRGGIRLKRYLDEAKGSVLQSLWTDISPINSQAKERLGFQTQKPLELLNRIISASSNPGDVILDPFCGCGTAVHAAQKLERRWIGIDITYLAINLIERRMQDAFAGIEIETIGAPIDLASARDLARRDKWQFQWWGLTRINAQPVAGKKKGADRGIDGVIPYFAGPTEDYKRAIVSVKGGENVSVRDIRDLVGVLDRENEPVGIFLTLTPPTKSMITEAVAAGFYESEFWGRKFPRIQILTIEEMFDGKRPNLPWGKTPFANAQREKGKDNQISIDIKDGNERDT